MSDYLPSLYLDKKKSEILIHGYLRTNAAEMNIPIDVIDLCIIWYFDPFDHWDLDNIDLNKFDYDAASNIIGCTDEAFEIGHGYCSVVGSIVISKLIEQRIWKIKLIEPAENQNEFYFVVGLVSTKFDHIHSDCDFSDSDFGYGYDAFDGSIRPSGTGFLFDDVSVPEKGDILSIKYVTIKDDSDPPVYHGEMRFDINEVTMVPYCKHIAVNDGETYRFAVSFYTSTAGEKIELLQ